MNKFYFDEKIFKIFTREEFFNLLHKIHDYCDITCPDDIELECFDLDKCYPAELSCCLVCWEHATKNIKFKNE